ncbi:MAG: NAD(+) synthase [Desulfovibrionaceae bacterium]|nr:NAD(+) synthase [Desulfovibrionaceae bacterium]
MNECSDRLRAHLVRGIREFARNNGFSDVVIGLSGGIDSALVAVLATEALGAEHVFGVLMPSRFSSRGSVTDALCLADNLRIRTVTVPIEPVRLAFEQALAPSFAGMDPDVTEENLQSRIRGVILMAQSNKFHRLLLATGNRSEILTGYCTLYGDTCGGLAPIGALYKTEVYALSRHINQSCGTDIIPQAILLKAPSAELRPDQTDQDSLPPYEILDPVLRHLTGEEDESPKAETLFDRETIDRVRTLMARAAFKRRYLPPVIERD